MQYSLMPSNRKSIEGLGAADAGFRSDREDQQTYVLGDR